LPGGVRSVTGAQASHFTTKHTKEGIQRKGAKDAKAGFARVNAVESRAV
jgi:hypothetical protein